MFDFLPSAESFILKEMGFDEPCIAYYIFDIEGQTVPTFKTNQPSPHGGFKMFVRHNSISKADNINKCSAPTISQVFNWFNKNYNLFAFTQSYYNEQFYAEIKQTAFPHKYSTSKLKIINEFKTQLDAEIACVRKMIEVVKDKEKE